MAEFSARSPGSARISISQFADSMRAACEHLGQSLGIDHPASVWLRNTPPLPMHQDTWNRQYAVYMPQGAGGTIQVRPDLLGYPLLLVATLAHESTHATDPLVIEATDLARKTSVVHPHAPDYFPLICRHARAHYQAEVNAVAHELIVLQRANASDPVLAGQDFFAEQRDALIAWRTRVATTNDTRRQLVETSGVMLGIITSGPPGISQQMRDKGEALAQALFNASQASLILDNAWVTSVNHILDASREFFLCMPDSTESVQCRDSLSALQNRLPQAYEIIESNATNANKRKLPPLKII